MQNLTLRAVITNGTIKFLNKFFLNNLLKQFEGQEVSVIITDEKRKRSAQQNNWYWGVAIPVIQEGIKEQTGEKYKKDDIHDYNISKIMKPEANVKVVNGETIVVYKIKRTSEMKVTEFMDFKDKIQEYWSERDIIVPDPNQTEFL